VIVVPLTSQADALRFPGTVLIERGAANGLGRDSVALAFQVTVIDQNRLAGKLGTLADETIASIFSALDELMGRAGGVSNR
jgi:mRNA-degrading endonuclease toxin of MazEF toxin-antitoxin module